MEKQGKPKNKPLKFLARAASAVTFQSPPFSPGGDKRSEKNARKNKTHIGKGFSGPFVSMIPAEARRKTKNSSFETQEPTSPKVSCIGQIKHKKIAHQQKNKKISPSLPKEFDPLSSPSEPKKKSSRKVLNLFGGSKSARRKSDASADTRQNRAPGLSQMRRFSSGRDTFANFDWTAQIVPAEDPATCDSDEDRGDSDGEEAIIPFSAPIGSSRIEPELKLEPRKEINLWKRRTMAQPKPLQLNNLVKSN